MNKVFAAGSVLLLFLGVLVFSSGVGANGFQPVTHDGWYRMVTVDDYGRVMP